jgi:thioredoxin reductase (NADPH)
MRDYDLIVIGAGVAGLTAAIHGGRYGLRVAVIDRIGVGGQIATAERIENFPGFPDGIAGHELGPLLHEQAEAAGAELMLDTVTRLQAGGDKHVVQGQDDSLRAPAVIVAAGSSPRRLGVPGEDRLLGHGVSHCASCDAPLFAGRAVGVVGGGDGALDEALVLAGHAARVTVFHRGGELRAQHVLRQRATVTANLDVALNTVVDEILGEAAVVGVRVRESRGGESRVHDLAGIFISVGLEPNSAFLRGTVTLDAGGQVETDLMMRTSLAGVFAAGDIRAHSAAQLASVAGDGATAAIAAFRYLKALG